MTSRQRLGLLAALGGALLLRVLLVLSLRDAPYFDDPVVDSAAYDAWAQRIAAGDVAGSEVFYQDPLYPYALGLFYAVFGRDLLWVRLVQCLVGTAGLWMLFEAARRTWGYRAGMMALALGGAYKTFLFYDAAILKDFLGVVAVEGALLLATLDRRWKWLAFGAALGAGTLVRGNLLLLAAAAAAFLAVRREWKPAGAILAGALAAILPVTVRNAAVSGEFVLTTAQLGPNLYTGNNPDNLTGRYRPPPFVEQGAPGYERSGFYAEAERRTGRPMSAAEVDAYWRNEALRTIASNPGAFLGVTLKRLAMLVNDYEVPDNYNLYFMARFSWVLRLPLLTFGLLLAPLAVAGMVCGDRKGMPLMFVLLAAYAASICFFFMFARYRLPMVPMLVLFAAAGADRLLRWFPGRTEPVPRAGLAALAAAAVLVNLPLPLSIGGHRDFRIAHRNLGLHHHRHGRHAEAAAEFDAAAALDPDLLRDPAFVWTRAEACRQSGRDDEALEGYVQVARADTVSPEPAWHAGMIYLRRGLPARAVEWLSRAAERDPSFEPVWIPLAEAHLARSDSRRAVEILERAAEALPDSAEVRLKRARLLLDRSMKAEAERAVREALEIDPDSEEARRLLEEARRLPR